MNKRDKIKKHYGFVVVIVVLFSFSAGPQLVSCQKNAAAAGGSSGAGFEIFAKELYNSMSNYTNVFKGAIKKELGYCILDV